MTQPFYAIASIGNGQLLIGPRPGADVLEAWCADAEALGIDLVVSLISPQEVERHGLQIEPAELAARGIRFRHIPIKDYDIPYMDDFGAVIRDIAEQIGNGRSVFVHCAGGVGRSGLLASCLLIADGMPADKAMALVSRRRGVRVPETPQQADFIRSFTP